MLAAIFGFIKMVGMFILDTVRTVIIETSVSCFLSNR